MRSRLAAIAALLVLASPALHASVAWRPVYGGRGFGIGGATAATADDATATLVNPALLVKAEGLTADVGSLVFYHPSMITYRRDPDELSPAGYREVATENDSSVIPYAGITYHGKDARWAFGLGVHVPFAEDLRWPGNGPQRYWATSSEFSFIYLTPSAAVRLGDRFAIGAGPTVVRFEGEIRTKLDFGSLAGHPEDPAFDGNALLQGDGNGVGFNFGVLWQPHDRIDVGLGYLSAVSFTADGTREVGIPIQLQQALGLPAKIVFTREELEVRMPEIWRVGASFEATKDLTLMAEVQFVDRSSEEFTLKNLGSTSPEILPDSVEPLTPEPFSSALTYKVGGEYTHDDWAFRLGAVVDQNGVPDASMSPAGVDTRKFEATAGVGYTWNKARFDLAYARVFGDERHVTESEFKNRISERTANGLYQVDTNIIALGLQLRF